MISFKHFRKLDCQKEFEDFTDESRQLEQELETTLIQNEKQIRDLNAMIISLRDDNDSLRVSKEEKSRAPSKSDSCCCSLYFSNGSHHTSVTPVLARQKSFNL
jgi:hypothetical protein